MTADDLIVALEAIADPAQRPAVARFYKGDLAANRVMGVPIGKVFPVAKGFTDLGLDQIETLLDDDRYEVRMAAVAVMDFKARRKTLPAAHRAALFDLYLRRHDRIDNWDLVDRAAPHVIGEFLVDGDRSVLDDLAQAAEPARRRTALVATHAFLKRDQTGDTFRIAARLAADTDTYVQKAVASWTREAGKRDADALVWFLEAHAAVLPRATVTAASKGLPEALRRRLRAAAQRRQP